MPPLFLMKLPWITLAAALLAGAGCSKKAADVGTTSEPAADSASPQPAEAKPAADDGAYDPSVAATVPVTPGGGTGKGARTAVAAGAGAQNWDAVVAEIVQLRGMAGRTSDQTQRLNTLQDEIVGAINTDPAAKEAYQNLSRLINRR